jgi:hypothetical protein
VSFSKVAAPVVPPPEARALHRPGARPASDGEVRAAGQPQPWVPSLAGGQPQAEVPTPEGTFGSLLQPATLSVTSPGPLTSEALSSTGALELATGSNPGKRPARRPPQRQLDRPLSSLQPLTASVSSSAAQLPDVSTSQLVLLAGGSPALSVSPSRARWLGPAQPAPVGQPVSFGGSQQRATDTTDAENVVAASAPQARPGAQPAGLPANLMEGTFSVHKSAASFGASGVRRPLVRA